ncbi:hypothetical protein [Moorena producens]|uniref:hypothetical protein n=1 Tax=Moorena producens TaxID=1155739 RepID=UPI001314DCFB|nr:hypothetical protein [Moorena producens]
MHLIFVKKKGSAGSVGSVGILGRVGSVGSVGILLEQDLRTDSMGRVGKTLPTLQVALN